MSATTETQTEIKRKQYFLEEETRRKIFEILGMDFEIFGDACELILSLSLFEKVQSNLKITGKTLLDKERMKKALKASNFYKQFVNPEGIYPTGNEEIHFLEYTKLVDHLESNIPATASEKEDLKTYILLYYASSSHKNFPEKERKLIADIKEKNFLDVLIFEAMIKIIPFLKKKNEFNFDFNLAMELFDRLQTLAKRSPCFREAIFTNKVEDLILKDLLCKRHRTT